MFFLKIQNFFRNHAGGFSLLTAILLPIVIISIGIAIELVHIFYSKVEMHSIIDRALLNTALELAKKKNRFIVGRTVPEIWKNNFHNELVMDGFSTEIDDVMRSTLLSVDSPYDTKNLSVVSKYKVPFDVCSLIPLCKNKYDYVTVLVTSSMKIGIPKNFGMDMMVVLDVSKSMVSLMPPKRTITRIEVVKTELNAMLKRIEKISNVKNVVRTGLVTFADKVVESLPLDWGIKRLVKSMRNMKFGINTDSTPGMQYAYDQIFDKKATSEHRSRGHEKHKKYIIFLTDGENNSMDSDFKSLSICNMAKEQGAIIYTIDIQYAKERAEKFLKNCSSPDHFYLITDLSLDMHNVFSNIGQDIIKNHILYDR
ncbi:vWA domain-containing protein [Candidatus Liberibacter africanus]|uniref:vWA domain-containing protein n=1 Tax=Liberibacter africanus TaxID=34020 RepID=UPI00339D7767